MLFIRDIWISFGGNSGGETPVLIPNTAVKSSSADDTARATSWESRSLPGVFVSLYCADSRIIQAFFVFTFLYIHDHTSLSSVYIPTGANMRFRFEKFSGFFSKSAKCGSMSLPASWSGLSTPRNPFDCSRWIAQLGVIWHSHWSPSH